MLYQRSTDKSKIEGLFPEVKKKYKATLWGFGLLCCLMYYFEMYSVLLIMVYAVALYAVLFDPHIGLGCFIVSSFYIAEQFSGTTYVVLLTLIILSFYVHSLRKGITISSRSIFVMLITVIIIIVSYMTGYKSDLNNAILMLMCILLFLTISQRYMPDKINLSIYSYIVSGLYMCIYVFMEYVTGGDFIKHGRVNFAGNSKILAAACLIPLAFLLCSYISSKKLFSSRRCIQLSDYIIVAIYVIAIMLSAARGMLLSLLIGVGLQIFLERNKGNAIWKLVPLFIILCTYTYFTLYVDSLRTSRLINVSDYSGFSGRFEIWKYYYEYMKNQGVVTILFGIGPGNITRVSFGSVYEQSYAHSTVLDYFYSYGLVGISAFITFEFNIFKRLLNSSNIVLLSVYIISLLMYLTHNVSANITMYILHAILYVASSVRKCV